ncbi:hypothetical protein BgiMline_030114, partial [Biomphalaria glabrata]
MGTTLKQSNRTDIMNFASTKPIHYSESEVPVTCEKGRRGEVEPEMRTQQYFIPSNTRSFAFVE